MQSHELRYKLAEIWRTAKEAEIGIEVKTNDTVRARQYLYQFRKKELDETYSGLLIKLTEEPNKIQIIHKEKYNAK